MKKRNFIRLSILFSVLFSYSTNTYSSPEWPEIKNTHKPFTRWWWFGSAVDSVNLSYNLEEYSRAGMGGVEITPIYGVKGEEHREIPYLSDKWMDHYKFTVAESERLGMSVDLNNGTGWPCGGPEVSIEEAASRWIIKEYKIDLGVLPEYILPDQPEKNIGATLCRLMAYGDKGEIIDATRYVSPDGKLEWIVPSGNWTMYAVFNGKTYQEVKRMAPGGEGYVMDHFNEQAVLSYFSGIEAALKASNSPMPRMFFNDSYEVYGADWTADFFDQFEERRGYKLEEYIPQFIANDTTEVSRRVITDYRQTVNDILMDNFIVVWKNWAHKNGSLIRNQSHGSPGNLIDIYAAVDVPECESFGRTQFDIPLLRKDLGMKQNDSNPTVLKFASSGANITGGKLVSSETFTWLTEHFRTSLSQCKPELDQMFVSGVNHLFFHGTPYSPRDAEWPGWLFYASVNISPTNTIWRDAPAFFKYISRCQAFLQETESDNDFLLYFPIYDLWNNYRNSQYMAFSIHGLLKIIPEFNDAVVSIMDAGYDLDYISDNFIMSLEVENGKLVTRGGSIYEALIIPSCKIMPHSTMEKIINLSKKGATVIFNGNYPEDVPGLSELAERKEVFESVIKQFPSSDFSTAAKYKSGHGNIITGCGYEEILKLSGTKKEVIQKGYGAQYIRKKHYDGHLYFISMLQDKTIDGWVPLAVDANSIIIYDPVTGDSGYAQTRKNQGNTELYLQLEPGQSLILKTTMENIADNAEMWNYFYFSGTEIKLDRGWELSFLESSPSIDGSYMIDTLVCWTGLPSPNAKVNMGTAVYRNIFSVSNDDLGEWMLDLGDVRESARVKINGNEVATLFSIPFKTKIGKYLRKGENVIEIEVTNLPANRIADYDRRGIEWRKFKDINFVDIFYKSTKYDEWELVPSGLLGPVTLRSIEKNFRVDLSNTLKDV